MNLPRKDKNGESYLSYSQVRMFLKNKQEYYDTYILGKPFVTNQWIEFGSKVGNALEHDSYDDFSQQEQSILRQCVRLDHFEYPVRLQYDGFYVLGFIDTCSADFTRIIDYKTGGKNKEYQYSHPDYWQLAYYALGIKQMHGEVPLTAEVQFIRRSGYDVLTVANEPPKLMEVDISMEKLKRVYWRTIEIAKQIQQFYETYSLQAGHP